MCFSIKIHPTKSIYIYFLLYKLHNCNLLWIIEISENYQNIKNRIISISREEKVIGKYLIIERYEKKSIINKNFKQFQLYEPKIYDYVLFESN